MKRLQNSLIGLTLFAAASMQVGCGSSDFAAGGGKAAPRNADVKKTLPTTQPDGATTEISGERVVQTFIAQASRPVDIVMALDTSASMLEEKIALENNITSFIDQMTKAHIDAQITMLARTSSITDTLGWGYSVNFPKNDRFRIVDQYIHSNNAIGHLTNFFAGQYGYPFALRDNAVIEVIIISDDDGINPTNLPSQYLATGNLASEFVGPANKDLVVNAIVGMTAGVDPNNSDCVIAKRGDQHIQLSQKTKGSQINLCEKDWSVLMKNLSDTIAARRAVYDLSHAPDLNLEIVVSVDGVTIDPADYTIDPVNKSLRFADALEVSTGAQVRVEYYYTK